MAVRVEPARGELKYQRHRRYRRPKYRLLTDAVFHGTGYKLNGSRVSTLCGLVTLFKNGKLVVKKGYWWDGPSGGIIDTKANLRPSLAHDALYDLMRDNPKNFGKKQSVHRRIADEYLRTLLDWADAKNVEIIYDGVRSHGEAYTRFEPGNRVKRAT